MEDMESKILLPHNDRIDNLAHELCQALVNGGNDDTFPWSMYHIANVTSMTEQYLQEQGFDICHPFFEENERLCFNSDQRCKHCTVIINPFRFEEKE